MSNKKKKEKKTAKSVRPLNRVHRPNNRPRNRGRSKINVKGILSGPDAKAHFKANLNKELSADTAGLVNMIDTFDRPGDAYTKKTYSFAEEYANGFEDKPGKRVPKAGLCVGVGLGLARAEWSFFDAEAKGPNACVHVEASAASLGVGAFAKAEVASASATAGPVKAKVGLALDTGASVGLGGIEIKVLGTGFSFGRKWGFSLFGNSIEFNF